MLFKVWVHMLLSFRNHSHSSPFWFPSYKYGALTCILASLIIIYLPLYSEKASSAKPHHLLPSSREILHKFGKILSLFFRYSFRDSFNIAPYCSSIPKGMLDNTKTLCYIRIHLILLETIFFFYSPPVLFQILFKYIPKICLHFDYRIRPVQIIRRSFF